MSEFSQKLMDCIAASGYSIYQLAKEASLDRTTLQKTAKGQRLPSLDYIKDICRYMKISQKQEEELYRLYQIEKLGKDTVASWDEIHQIIVDIGEIRQKTKSNLNIHFKQQSFHHFNEDITREFFTELECMKAIMCVIEEELEEQEIPEVYMDVSWASQFALDQLMQSNSSQEKKVICHQLLNLKCTDEKRKVCLENIKMLHQVLPYAFTTPNEYDVRYAYVRENEAEEKFHLWPHYVVTKKHVVLCSNEKKHMVILSNEQIAEVYRKELDKMMKGYRLLFDYQGYSGEGIKKYRKLMDSDETRITYEPFPCVALMIPDEIKIKLMNDKKMGKIATAFFDLPLTKSSSFINVFGMKEIRKFICYGHLPGIYDQYFNAESKELRKAMLDNFYGYMSSHARQFYMINEKEFPIGSSFGIEMYGKRQVVFYSTSKELSFGFISIDEPGIVEAFASYFSHLIDSKYVYGIEESIIQYEKTIDQLWREMEEN